VRAGETPSPLVDPGGYVKLIADFMADDERELPEDGAALAGQP